MACAPVQKDDIYDLASITKTSSALLFLMQQYEAGKLDLDAGLSTYFPLFEGTDKDTIQLRAALAHQGKLRPWVPYWQTTLRGQARYPWEEDWQSSKVNDFNFRHRTLRSKPSGRFPIRLTDELFLHRRFKQRYIYRTIRKTPLEKEAKYKYSGLLFYLLPNYVTRDQRPGFPDLPARKILRPTGGKYAGLPTAGPWATSWIGSSLPSEIPSFGCSCSTVSSTMKARP